MIERIQTLSDYAGRVKTECGPYPVVELGVNLGKSLIAMAQTAELVYGIDLWDMRLPEGNADSWRESRGFIKSSVFREFLLRVSQAGVTSRVRWIKGDTHEIGKAWSQPIGLLHIDAAHDRVSVLQDYRLWSPFVAQNGFLCMDDAAAPEKVGSVIEDVVKPSGLWKDYEYVSGGRLFIARRK